MISELRTFLAVARCGTFALAGRNIGLTQSAVSSQIKRLEASLGFELFDRTGRAATLNAAGHVTLVRAEEVVALFNKLREPPGDAPPSRPLRIGAIASAQTSLLPALLPEFRQQFPSLALRILPGVSMRLLDQVDAGEIDAAIIIRPTFGLPRELGWHGLERQPFRLAVQSTVKGKDWRRLLSQHPFVRYDRTSFGGRLVDRFLRAVQIAPDESVEVDEIDAIFRFVANGAGVALVPQTRGSGVPPGVRLVSLGDQTFYREIGLVHRALRGAHPALPELIRLCVRHS